MIFTALSCTTSLLKVNCVGLIYRQLDLKLFVKYGVCIFVQYYYALGQMLILKFWKKVVIKNMICSSEIYIYSQNGKIYVIVLPIFEKLYLNF